MKKPSIALFAAVVATTACQRPPGTPDEASLQTNDDECGDLNSENPCPGTPAPEDTADPED